MILFKACRYCGGDILTRDDELKCAQCARPRWTLPIMPEWMS